MEVQDRGIAAGFTGRLARSAAARPRRALGIWLAAVVVSLGLVATTLHGLSSSGHAAGAPDSAKAEAAVARAFPAQAQRAASDVIIVSSNRSIASSPAFRAELARIEAGIRALPGVRAMGSYLEGTPGLVSAGGHATLIRLAVHTDAQIKPVVSLVQHENGKSGFAVGVTGDHTVAGDFATLSQRDLSHAELAFGLPAALVVLVLVFGAVVAGLVPVVLALLSIIVAIGVTAILSQAFSLSTFVVNMITGMGLALGIDYALFVLSRFREERARGHEKLAAIELAGSSASRAVLFSGSTFVVAMFGMLLVPTSVMRSLATGAIVVGVVSVVAALTLLPALLSLLGDRVDALRVRNPFRRRRPMAAASPDAESRFWSWVINRVLRRPGISLAVAASAMLLAAVPVLGLHVGANGVSTLPNSMPAKQGYAMLQRSFPAQNPYPVQIVTLGGGQRAQSDLVALKSRLGHDPQFGQAMLATAPGVLVLDVPIKGDPTAAAAISAVRHLRASVIPSVFAGTSAHVYVGGKTADNVDYFDAVTNPTAYVLAFVLLLSFVVLLLAFRSVAIALVSIALNLLSVGAAYGLLTLVFVHGVGASLFGFQRVHTIEAWVPLFLFSVLFGLSMDYQVFLMSRIKERRDQGASTRAAVTSGVASTARIITGAALIIIVVFTGFASGELVMFQQMGFGIAIALLLDATVIRSVVLPSLLVLLDEHAWYLPRWLDWLPDLSLDQPQTQPS